MTSNNEIRWKKLCVFYRWAKKSITFYLLSRDMYEYIRARLMCWNGERWTRTSRWANTGSCVSCGEHRLVCLPTTRAAAAAADIWTLLRKHVGHIVHKHRLHWSLKIIFIQLLLATSPLHTPRGAGKLAPTRCVCYYTRNCNYSRYADT